MAALLEDVTVFHVQDRVGIADGLEAVGDYEGRTAFHHLRKSILDSHLCHRIDG